MLKRYEIANNRLIESSYENSSILVSINPDENEKRFMIDEYKIDEHTLNSSLDPDELSRLEFEPDHIAIIFKRPKNYSGKEAFLFKVASSGVFLFKDKLIIVMSEDIPIFDGKPFLKVNTLAEVMLKIIYRSIFHFLEHLRIINMISDELEKKINISMENSYLINLFSLEKSLVYYLNSINSNNVLIEKLKINSSKIGLSQEELEFLDDMMIENNQCFKQAEIYSNILASLMDARASIVSNNLNLLMKTLNIITICIMVPTLVVSAFSMNVKIPLAELEFAFWIIMGLGLLSLSIVLYFWKRKWR
ncbi:MAG: magnesium transporter CorA family protein [Ignavibacteria bacterium]|nr:magnesium transporter CorA family protein [Ignavibacteria bacterium]